MSIRQRSEMRRARGNSATALLGERRRITGTLHGHRAGLERTQAKQVLRWFRDDVPLRLLATEAGQAISTSYLYLHD